MFAELIQYLEDRSLSLVMREASNGERKALNILREHYLSKSKLEIISLCTELTSLKRILEETVTDYIIRAETTANALRMADEIISDCLLISMVNKGLPSDFKAFTTVVTQREKPMTLSNFKVTLRSYE